MGSALGLSMYNHNYRPYTNDVLINYHCFPPDSVLRRAKIYLLLKMNRQTQLSKQEELLLRKKQAIEERLRAGSSSSVSCSAASSLSQSGAPETQTSANFSANANPKRLFEAHKRRYVVGLIDESMVDFHQLYMKFSSLFDCTLSIVRCLFLYMRGASKSDHFAFLPFLIFKIFVRILNMNML